jgi:hypothetical protein
MTSKGGKVFSPRPTTLGRVGATPARTGQEGSLPPRAQSGVRLEGTRTGTSSWLTVVSAPRRPSCGAWAHAAHPVLFSAPVRAYPLGLLITAVGT